MAENTKRIFIGLGMIGLAMLACQGSSVPAPQSTPTNIDVNLLVTSLYQTMTSQALAGQTGSSLPLPFTDTPSLSANTALVPTTEQPAPPPTLTLVPSPAIPLISVSGATNCRTGPGEAYEVVLVVDQGQQYPVIGRYNSTYWIIQLGGGFCWLWGGNAIVVGNVNSLPEFAAPPPPTLTPTTAPAPGSSSSLGAVEGVVSDSNQNPLAGLLVENILTGKQTQTNNSGYYRFDNLPAGRVYISVTGDSSHVSDFLPVTVIAGLTTPANFSLASGTPGPCKNPVGGTVQGKVIFRDSSPVGGARVWVWMQSVETPTDNLGIYRIPNVCPGFRLVLAEWKGKKRSAEITVIAGVNNTAPNIVIPALPGQVNPSFPTPPVVAP